MIRNIRWMVYTVALTLTIVPALAAYYVVSEVSQSAVQLGFNRAVSDELGRAGERLKELARANPVSEESYREQFAKLQETRQAYETLLKSAPNLQLAYLQAFYLILGIALSVALLLAWWLNRRIIRSHDSAIAQVERAKERALFLEQSESWRLFAQKLVHEIKNPLTPVQVMIGRLPQKYSEAHAEPSHPFKALLADTKLIVDEEIGKVNHWVEAFSRYARMPIPQIRLVPLKAPLEEFLRQYADYWDHLSLELKPQGLADEAVNCDPVLLKQALFNLAKNCAEASAKPVQVKLALFWAGERNIAIEVSDNGPGLPPEVAKHLFQPYVSQKGDKGMGLGLAIAKKILLEQGGDLVYRPSPQGCTFQLTLSAQKGIEA